MFDTNAVGVIRVTQAALPLLRKSGNPVVVNVSSALGSFWAVTNPGRPASRIPVVHAYGASKAAVSMLTLQYAKVVPEIKFNAVEPGYTATDFGSGSGGRPVEESAKVVVRMATISMRPSVMFANSPPGETDRLRARLRGPWRQGLRAVMVLLSLHGLPAGEIAALLECHPGTVRRWISRFSPDGLAGLADRPRYGRPRLGGRRLGTRITALLQRPGPWTVPRSTPDQTGTRGRRASFACPRYLRDQHR